MPSRMRNVRLSVRPLSEGKDSTHGTPTQSWTHDRYQKFDLHPLSGEQVLRMQRAGYDADWRAVSRAKPAVHDGDRLVSFVDGAVELMFIVQKRLRRGRYQELLLKEVSEVQS